MRSILYPPAVFILLFLVNTFASAQSETINLSLKDTTVEAIVNEIRNQTDFDFIYNHEQLARCPRVSIEMKGGSVEEVLTQCLKNTGFSFEKVNNAFIITPIKEKQRPNRSRQPTQTLRGIVRDRESKVPMPFASIEILNSEPRMGTMSDLYGTFELKKVPVGRHSIRVTYVGYEEAILSEVLVGSAKEVLLSIEISESTQNIGEVSVTMKQGEPLNQMVTVSGRSFNVEETKRSPASISDPARMAQVFAGVAGTEDSKNEMVIRGNSPQSARPHRQRGQAR